MTLPSASAGATLKYERHSVPCSAMYADPEMVVPLQPVFGLSWLAFVQVATAVPCCRQLSA
ncbi:Uncharacterised protein [Mycobacteroides abscessus subsp. abscessus]|nr:Uncharacterised protein [Mycobacteroides abscessus subsp. abscessus]SKJ44481.1 Uncharacterised protein [Mycobacteroides abscessus subsp. massiliense]